jgi:hypothetical protein
MQNKILIVALVILTVLFSGCIQSDASRIDQSANTINNHLKAGDDYYNSAASDSNKQLYSKALEECDNATNEFSQAKSSAQDANTYAKNSKEVVFIEYVQNVLNEIDAKLNATSELKTAVTFLQKNSTTTGNQHLTLANNYMEQALVYKGNRESIVEQNAAKFK